MDKVWLIPLGAVLAGVGCSGPLEPGALTITLDATPPELTNATTVQVAGQVTRTPAAEDVPIVVSVTGGGTTQSDTADANNRFTFTVTLSQNAENQIQLSATDESGSTGAPLTVTVVHDGIGPTVVQITPATQTDGVTPTEVTVRVSEPVHSIQGSGLVVSRLGAAVPGTVTMSADSLTFTFTPTVPFVTNAIHTIAAGGFRDAVGNQETGSGACFITAGAELTFDDPVDDYFFTQNPPAEFVPTDLQQLRLVRGGGEFRAVFRFTNPRSLSPTATNWVVAVIDLDTDQDGSTGSITLKDIRFEGTLALSGIGAEGGVWLLPETSFVLEYPGDLRTVDPIIVHEFIPDLCGVFVGYGIPEASLGDDDGMADFVIQSEMVVVINNQLEGYADPSPETGFHTMTLTGPPPVLAATKPLGVPFSERRVYGGSSRLMQVLQGLRRRR